PVGPPAEGFVQAGNVIAEYDRPNVPNVSNAVVTTNDPDNFAPRVGFAYSLLDSGHLVVRGGYGIFYSRASFAHLGNAITLPPNYVIGRKAAVDAPQFSDPFVHLPSAGEFPVFVRSVELADQVF